MTTMFPFQGFKALDLFDNAARGNLRAKCHLHLQRLEQHLCTTALPHRTEIICPSRLFVPFSLQGRIQSYNNSSVLSRGPAKSTKGRASRPLRPLSSVPSAPNSKSRTIGRPALGNGHVAPFPLITAHLPVADYSQGKILSFRPEAPPRALPQLPVMHEITFLADVKDMPTCTTRDVCFLSLTSSSWFCTTEGSCALR